MICKISFLTSLFAILTLEVTIGQGASASFLASVCLAGAGCVAKHTFAASHGMEIDSALIA